MSDSSDRLVYESVVVLALRAGMLDEALEAAQRYGVEITKEHVTLYADAMLDRGYLQLACWAYNGINQKIPTDTLLRFAIQWGNEGKHVLCRQAVTLLKHYDTWDGHSWPFRRS